MSGYTLLLDESYDDQADVYVIGGVIVATDRLNALTDAIGQVTYNLSGSRDAEIKFADAPSVRKVLSPRGISIGQARWAMAGIPETVGGVTLVASIILDPTVDPKAGSLNPLSWAFQRSLTHFTNFLSDAGASTAPGSHQVIADRFPNKQHKTVFHESYREGYSWAPYGPSPRVAGLMQWITESDATFCPPLRLADHFAGAVRAWALAERRFDQASDARRTPHREPKLMLRYMPSIRGGGANGRRKAGYGLSMWPKDYRPQLDLWLARARGVRVEEAFTAAQIEVSETDGGVPRIRLTPGTRRTWE